MVVAAQLHGPDKSSNGLQLMHCPIDLYVLRYTHLELTFPPPEVAPRPPKRRAKGSVKKRCCSIWVDRMRPAVGAQGGKGLANSSQTASKARTPDTKLPPTCLYYERTPVLC